MLRFGGQVLIGTQLDKYEIQEKIGEGGMATVYRGTHTTLGREVAIKVLHPHLSNALKNRKRFAREARTIERMEHENILKIYDYSGEDAELCYIVTELIEGETLKDLIQRDGMLPSELVALIGVRLADGLNFAHEAGVIHRDIKPENVMLRMDGALKLMDFGIARFVEESSITMTGSLIGSPAYMSPEQVLERTPDKRSDLFSFGAMLFRLTTGQLAFPGNNPSVILKKVIEGDHPRVMDLVPSANPALAKLIEQLLSPSPDSRPSSANEVAESLREILRESGIEEHTSVFSLKHYLEQPGSYEDALRQHLETVLNANGQRALQANAHQLARDNFNRLLAINPEHPEVLEVLSNLAHLGQDKSVFLRVRPWIGISLLVLAGIGIWLSAADREAPSSNPDLASIESPASNPNSVSLVEQTESSAEILSVTTNSGAQKPTEEASPETPPVPERTKRANRPPPPEATTLSVIEPLRPPEAVPTPDIPEQDASVQKPEATTGTLIVGLSSTQRGVWADVYIDGESRGRTRGGGAPLTLELPAGPHQLKITNDYALAFQREVELKPGSTLRMEDVTLSRRPIRVQIQRRLNPNCNLVLNGQALGEIGALNYQSSISDAQDAQGLHIRCPDGTMHGPYDFPALRPGEVLRMPPLP